MSIEVGVKLPGKVSGITNFGAFVDLGEGKTGLVHISEVSNSFVKDINDVLTVGDEVEVKVMTIGDDGKIGLSIKRANEEERPARDQRPPKKDFKRQNNNFRSDRNDRPDRSGNSRKPAASAPKKEGFDSLMSSFLKDSDERLSSIKRNTEGKRGGRGGRRS
ncbi:S1 domain-containing RNA-binding protein [Vagococcus carniphilus]|uniref:RNA-binding protein S1 n=1 Tax=Vagococcus carniphilus TaxID=218144 RepID=A0A430AV89_9ENTE|nr:S1 domain-containing RNA-binding protein [Vagococcus carniphilus]MDT2815265.1 S1 domain-containing RNA-binding protein [Vagococcus carniphilus]MDT2831271.1 S1 domain-containing RNA-binding protein [Vagococcus carniphilus]MDT2832955.1 S1 domain-containing RNA-binding protein [Vagococcus carniphilus]MDT2840395.1 S1 domain-containing RNA-binding protein [Vagococcus carniphilus]MDT2850270.1 S1 domain-containing RNA-binding protein [Vagococcus carniphilus]